MTHPVPCPESSPTPSHMHMLSVKTIIYVPSMTIFPKQKHFVLTKEFCFINQNPLDKLRYSLVFTKSHVFLWVANFQGLIAGFAHLPTLSQNFIAGYICLTKNIGFSPEGVSIPSCYTQHKYFSFPFLLCNHETHFGRCPIYRAHHRTPNIVSTYHVLTTCHRTPNTVSISIMHSHPCHEMSRA